MSCYDLFHVRVSSTANFDCVSVKYSTQWVVVWKTFVYYIKNLPPILVETPTINQACSLHVTFVLNPGQLGTICQP